jgi:hypothetical protein
VAALPIVNRHPFASRQSVAVASTQEGIIAASPRLPLRNACLNLNQNLRGGTGVAPVKS